MSDNILQTMPTVLVICHKQRKDLYTSGRLVSPIPHKYKYYYMPFLISILIIYSTQQH